MIFIVDKHSAMSYKLPTAIDKVKLTYIYFVIGDCVEQILKGFFTGVVHHHRYYAVNRYTSTIHVFVYTSKWKQRYSWSVDTRKGYTSLGIANNQLYACLQDYHIINIFSLSGLFKYGTGSKGSGGPGEFNSPLICATDTAGDVLIADYSNDRLQLLKANGQWSIVQLQPPVKNPWGACFMNETLYVSKHYNDTLLAYKME